MSEFVNVHLRKLTRSYFWFTSVQYVGMHHILDDQNLYRQRNKNEPDA